NKMNEFNINLFKKAIIGLNNNLENIGEIFHSNIYFFNSDFKIEDKKKGIDHIADEIIKIMPEIKRNYSDITKLYDEVKHNINEKTENKEEYVSFMKHIKEFFPSYIVDIDHCAKGIAKLDVKTAKYTEVTDELSDLLLNVKVILEGFITISENYLNDTNT
ncbi:hypothetical protein LJC03_03130, partial [Methanobrevibacter sp. OttesenSCG-928-I08]|nr:hypothetical protein [Methanobrevibacter sp. OttesenSCG-928-I08]